MSTNKTFSTETSERYSRALFEVAKENNELDKVENNVKIFQTVLNSSPEIQNFIKIQQIVLILKFLRLICSEKLGFSKNLQNFFLLMVEKRRIFFVRKIIESFLKLCSIKKRRGKRIFNFL